MIFTETPQSRSLEKMMTGIPNFKPRGHGVIVMRSFEYTAKMCDCSLCSYHSKRKGCEVEQCPYVSERIAAGTATIREVMDETTKYIRHPVFRRRLKQYVKESEECPMEFKNGKHRQVFDDAIVKLDKKNYALMAAVYLLTADHRLWNQSRRYVERNAVDLASCKPHGSSEDGYTLFCCAKDLCLGTKHISVSDLADTDIISPKLFALICNAMAIRRFGLGAIRYKERKVNV